MRWLLLALVGAVLCTLGDHLHATRGVLVYAHVALWDQAWWVPLLFALATLACVGGARPFLVLGRRAGRATGFRAERMYVDAAGFCVAYAYTSFAPFDHPTTTWLVLAGAFVVRVVVERRPPWIVAHSLVLALNGSLFEATLSSTGVFRYLHPDLIGIPRWLPGIYLHAGLVTGELCVLFTPARTSSP